MKRTGPSNIVLKNLMVDLGKLSSEQKIPFWRRLAKELKKPARNKKGVNLYKINRYTRDGETAVIPGKVLSLGTISKKITIAAVSFSDTAKDKIKASGSKMISLKELIKQRPKKMRLLK